MNLTFHSCRTSRRFRFVLSLLTLTTGVSVMAMADDVHVFYVGGQSNAVPDQFGKGIDESLAASGQFGDYVLITQQRPGAPMYTWVQGSENNPSRHVGEHGKYGEHFFNDEGTGALQKAVEAIRANGDTPKVTLFWFQGESDTSAHNSPEDWRWKFLAMLEFLREDLGQDGPIPVAFAIVDGDYDVEQKKYDKLEPDRQPMVDRLREIQRQLDADLDYAWSLDTRGRERTDAWHLTREARIQFGKELGALYAEQMSDPSTKKAADSTPAKPSAD